MQLPKFISPELTTNFIFRQGRKLFAIYITYFHFYFCKQKLDSKFSRINIIVVRNASFTK